MNWEAFFGIIALAALALAWAGSLIYTVAWLDDRWWGSGWAICLPLVLWTVVPCAVIAGLTV